MIVDAHHHFWDPARADYPWMTDELAAIRRAFGPHDFAPLLRDAGVAGTVLVQARMDLDETRELLETAGSTEFVLGVVGWVDLTDPDLPAVLHDLGHSKLVGVRHQVHDEPDSRWLLRPNVRRGLRTVAEAGLVYDLLVRTRELPAALATARALPELALVVDHLAKPPIASGDTRAWAEALAPLADLPNVSCKLSGLVTEAEWASWRRDDLMPYVRRALDWFGDERCLFGFDWPVCLLAASYADVLALVQGTLRPAERHAVLSATAARVYRLRL